VTAERLFTEEARARVTEAVRDAESHTVGQIVPVVVDRSAHYPEAALRAALIAMLLASAVLLWSPSLGATQIPFVLALAALAAVGLTLLWPGLQRLLIGRGSLDTAVQHRAMRAFVEHGVHHTQGETGVLVFASLFERRVVILGDRAIHEKMGEQGWKDAVAGLVAGLQRGAPQDGFVAAIQLVGAKLSEAFPRSGVPTANELPDDLRVDRT
jgi:putative membrane protein